MSLSEKHCVPCEGGTPPLNREKIDELILQISHWVYTEKPHDMISKTYTFENFAKALEFVNTVGALAEAEQHHPNIVLYDYKHVRLELNTHAIEGLSENDFIVAAKIDQLGAES